MMGVDSRRPPLPAPTESMDEQSATETELATNLTTRTDKTHWSIPEDGSPITIPTKVHGKKDGQAHHGRSKSQTSLLIEYFEASQTGDKSRSRPSVRVKVTPSAKKRHSGGNEAIQITGIGTDRKPSYTRRISLGNSSKNVETGRSPREATEVSHSSGSNVSGRPPIEIEVVQDGSDVSNNKRSSRGLMYAPVDSNVSSMPPDSLLEGEKAAGIDRSRMKKHEEEDADATPTEYLQTKQKSKPRKSSRSSRERSISKGYDEEDYLRERRRRSSRSQRAEEDTVSGAESSLLSSNLAPSHRSYQSGSSQASRMTNNPKLLEMVENTIKRMILPEINAIKEDQKVDRKLRKFSESGRDSVPLIDEDGLQRRVSKSSSTPNISSKPKVVLNRDGNDPGTVLSRGDSERVKQRKSSREAYSERPSSRRSSGQRSREGSYDDAEQKIRHKSSRSINGLRGAAAAGLAGGVLTAAALKHHDSQGDMHHRRKKRDKSRGSRSRSASINETTTEEAYTKGPIPPMPLASQINDSDVTRESILSQEADKEKFMGSATPVRELSRGSYDAVSSPVSSRTPTRTPVGQNLGMSMTNRSIESPRSPKSPNGSISNRARLAALTAAGLGGVALATNRNHIDADGYGDETPQRKISSPVQSVSSLRKNFEDEPLIPQGLRSHSAASRSSAGQLRSSRNSMQSEESSPTTKLAYSRKQSQNVGDDEFTTPLEQPAPPFARDGTQTPTGETAEEWFERQHLVNDRYRDSLDGATNNRDSYQTNPYPQDEKRFTMVTDDSFDRELEGDEDGDDRDVQHLGYNPNYVHTPVAVESAVASLMEPSTVSSNLVSSNGSSAKGNGTYSDRMAEQLRNMGRDAPPMYQGSTVSQTMPSSARWAAIKGHARDLSGSAEKLDNAASPSQSPRHIPSIDRPVMSASGLPSANDPMPEIGHYDSKSDLTTNPSIIHGPLGGDATGNDTWPYTPDPQQEAHYRGVHATKRDDVNDVLLGAAAVAAVSSARKTTVEEEQTRDLGLSREATPVGAAATFRDEGYVTDGRARSAGGITPHPVDTKDLGEDPFTGDAKRTRHFSGNSHGMDSPLYDSATGKGMDLIESKDIVALMDHLTVRDAQRNARDTEILVTLVRSAAEMRQSFDEMKKIIVEQDKIIMQNMERSSEQTAQKVLNSPRGPPMASPRTIRRPGESEDEIQTKRKGMLKRALKGLTGGKSAKDIARIEDMLMQILDNVEDLKMQQNGRPAPLDRSMTNDSLDSYEKLRNAPDPGYEPEGQAGTGSTPSQSGHFNVPTREKHQFHSGYDGRRGSEHRVSTVLEGDEDELEPHETHVLNHQFENNERMLTPTQENHRLRGLSPSNTPPAAFNNTPDKQRKHKSNSSSLFGVPKISRWSKTTASSAAPDVAGFDSPKQGRFQRPLSESSRSRSTLDQYDDDGYSLHDDDRLPSTQSLAKEQARTTAQHESRSIRSQGSKLSRTPSPLIPSEASGQEQDDVYDDVPSPVQEDDEAYLDDPKYHAHRHSILLQHPQPRAGATPRHQNNLESQAQKFDDGTGTNSDLSQRTVSDFDPAVWGSSGTAGLARHRLTQQVEPLSPVSMNSATGASHGARSGKYDDTPLVPQSKPAVPPKIKYEEPEDDWDEPQFSNSGFSKSGGGSGGSGGSGGGGGGGGYYSSPYGSGHLLEPIEEVRYSLETDSGRLSPEPEIASARAVPARKITGLTGPRPMGSRSSSAQKQQEVYVSGTTGTVRRKPVPGLGSSESIRSETF